MKKIIPALFVMSLFGFSSKRTGVVGKQFPDLKAETMDGKEVSIPQSTMGKSTIICMAHSSDAEPHLNSWLQPAYDKFIAKSELMSYDINLYFIPMFTGANIAFLGKAKKKMREGTDPEVHPYVLFYKGELKKYTDFLEMTMKDYPYIFVLNKDGKIVYTASGTFTQEKMDAIEDAL